MSSGQRMFDITVSAPGKVILFGEHSVVYKKAAVSTSINRRLYATIKSAEESSISVSFPQINTNFTCSLATFQKVIQEKCPLHNMETEFVLYNPELIDHNKYVESLKNDLEYLGVKTNCMQDKPKSALIGFLFIMRGMFNSLAHKLIPFSLEVKSELEVGAGTGSSAAFSVALSGLLLELRKNLDCNILSPTSRPLSSNDNVVVKSYPQKTGFSVDEMKAINKWAFCIEKIMHGRPSGIDNTTCTFGSVVATSQQEMHNELIFNVLGYVPKITILLISTGVSRNTANLVVKVRQLRDNNCASVDAILNAMDVIAQEAFKTLESLGSTSVDNSTSTNPDLYKSLGALMELNHGLLRTLGVSHVTLEQIVSVSSRHGLSCKLTGAGGGGYAISLVPPNFSKNQLEALKKELEPEFKVTEINIAEEGVRIEK